MYGLSALPEILMTQCICNQVYIFLSCHPGSVYVMYVCICVSDECVSSILYVVMHDYISSFEVPSSRFQEFL